MEYNQDYQEINEEQHLTSARPKIKGRKKHFFKKMAAAALCAALIGGISGGAFYGVNSLLGKSQGQQTEYLLANTVSGLGSTAYVSAALAAGPNLDVTEIAAQGLSSVVSVTNISVQEVQNYFGRFGRDGRGQTMLQETTSCGSGVIVYETDAYLYMVTNYHVIEDATTLSVTFVDDQTYAAEVCGYDESMDIALLRVALNGMSLDTLSQISLAALGDSDELVVGEQVVAIGNALGYGQSVTTGIVSALNRSITTSTGTATYIQTDAAINPGNSGGALFSMDGTLIGINTAKVSYTGVEGMGYAIPISEVVAWLQTIDTPSEI